MAMFVLSSFDLIPWVFSNGLMVKILLLIKVLERLFCTFPFDCGCKFI